MSKVMDVKEKDGKFYAYYLNLKKKRKKNCDFISVGKKSYSSKMAQRFLVIDGDPFFFSFFSENSKSA